MAIVIVDKNTELSETILLAPPRILGRMVLIGVLLLIAALVWAYVTEVDHVVKSPARVRTLACPTKSFNAMSGQDISALASGPVKQVCVKEGDTIKAGELLMQIDSQKIDHELSRTRNSLQTSNDEFNDLERVIHEYQLQRLRAEAKAEAELTEAEEHARSEQTLLEREEVRRRIEEQIAKIEVDQQIQDLKSKQELLKLEAIAAAEVQRVEFGLESAKKRM
jgi:hemolysin D